MCRINNINYPVSPKKNICNNLYLCVGAVLQKSGNEETLHLVEPEIRPLEIVVFFCLNILFVVYLPLKIL